MLGHLECPTAKLSVCVDGVDPTLCRCLLPFFERVVAFRFQDEVSLRVQLDDEIRLVIVRLPIVKIRNRKA